MYIPVVFYEIIMIFPHKAFISFFIFYYQVEDTIALSTTATSFCIELIRVLL